MLNQLALKNGQRSPSPSSSLLSLFPPSLDRRACVQFADVSLPALSLKARRTAGSSELLYTSLPFVSRAVFDWSFS